MEALIGIFTDPYRMGLLIVCLLVISILKKGDLLSRPDPEKRKWVQ